MEAYLMNKIDRKLNEVKEQYIKTIYLKKSVYTCVLQEYSDKRRIPRVNLGLNLSMDLMRIRPSLRPLKLLQLARQLIQSYDEVVLLSEIEILFEPSLQTDVIHILNELGKQKVLLINWPGEIKGDFITYASNTHKEYIKQSAKKLHYLN